MKRKTAIMFRPIDDLISIAASNAAQSEYENAYLDEIAVRCALDADGRPLFHSRADILALSEAERGRLRVIVGQELAESLTDEELDEVVEGLRNDEELARELMGPDAR